MLSASAVVGTELLERVQALAARYEPLGFSAVRDAQTAVESFGQAVELALHVPRWDTSVQSSFLTSGETSTLQELATVESRLQAAFPTLTSAFHGAQQPQVRSAAAAPSLRRPAFALGSAADAGPSSKSGAFERQDTVTRRAFVALVGSPQRPLPPKATKSFHDLTAAAMHAHSNTSTGMAGHSATDSPAVTAAPEGTPLSTPPADPAAAAAAVAPTTSDDNTEQHETARAAVAATLAELQLLIRVADAAFRTLSRLHFDVALSAASWRWVAQRSHRSRFMLRMLFVPWWTLVKSMPMLLWSAQVRNRVLRDEDEVIHNALLLCRNSDANVTHAIGTLHSVVTTLRSALVDVTESVEEEAIVMATAAADAMAEGMGAVAWEARQAAELRLLTWTYEQLRSLTASAGAKLAHACGASAAYLGELQQVTNSGSVLPFGRRPQLCAAMLHNFLEHLQESLAASSPPSATPRIKLLTGIVGVALAVAGYTHRADAAQLVERAVAAGRAYVIDPAVGMVHGLLTVPQRPDRHATLKELDSLKQMVVQYHQDQSTDKLTDPQIQAIEEAVRHSDLGRVSSDYIEYIRKPLLPLVKGLLPRLIFIQVQQQKVDMDMLLDSTNDVLSQNDLVFRMFACMPVGLLVTVLGTAWRRRHQLRSRALHADMRVCWWKLHRIMCGSGAGGHHSWRYVRAAAESVVGDESTVLSADGDVAEVNYVVQRRGDGVRQATATLPIIPPPRSTPPMCAADMSIKSEARSTMHTPPPAMPPPLTAVALTPVERGGSAGGGRVGKDGHDDRPSACGDVAESSSWGGALQPQEQGQVLIQVHALRVMGEMAWPQRQCEEKLRFFDDLDDLESKDTTRESRLRVLDRMAVSYSFLRHNTE